MSAAHTQGCCASKHCTDKTCMDLPTGKTCGDCVNSRHCKALYGVKDEYTHCDFFPRRFRERAAIAAAQGAQP